MDHFFHCAIQQNHFNTGQTCYAPFVVCCVLSVCLTNAGLIGSTGRNCCSSACPGKGQEKDGDESIMREFEIFYQNSEIFCT